MHKTPDSYGLRDELVLFRRHEVIRPILATLVIGVVAAFCGAGGVIAIEEMAGLHWPEKVSMNISQLGASAILALLVVIVCWRRPAPIREQLAIRLPQDRLERQRWLLVFGVALIAIALVPIGRELVGLQARPSTPDRAFWIRVIGAVVVAPVAEELLFRGYLFSRLTRAGLPSHVCIRTSALLFILAHLPDYPVSRWWWVIILVGLGGTVLGLVRQATASTLPSMVLHGLNNLMVIGAPLG